MGLPEDGGGTAAFEFPLVRRETSWGRWGAIHRLGLPPYETGLPLKAPFLACIYPSTAISTVLSLDGADSIPYMMRWPSC